MRFPRRGRATGACSSGRSTFSTCPGSRDPLTHRWPNWCGIVIRLTFALFFLSQGDGFTPMGIYDGLSGLLLLALYLPVVRSAGR